VVATVVVFGSSRLGGGVGVVVTAVIVIAAAMPLSGDLRRSMVATVVFRGCLGGKSVFLLLVAPVPLSVDLSQGKHALSFDEAPVSSEDAPIDTLVAKFIFCLSLVLGRGLGAN
jgi:hypothetical protein